MSSWDRPASASAAVTASAPMDLRPLSRCLPNFVIPTPATMAFIRIANSSLRALRGFEAIVLETDAPDIAPAWVHPARNSPAELPAIGAVLAGLRGMDVAALRQASCANALAVMPRLAALMVQQNQPV